MSTALAFYHYFYPDDVVSAQLFSQFCEELHNRGWQVTAMPCNRGYCNESRTFAPAEVWRGVRIRRIWRPPFRQASTVGRMINLVWMIASWSLKAFSTRPPPDVLIVGTDPPLSVLTAIFWKALHPKVKVVHWCYDLFPEAAVAEGILSNRGLVVRLIKRLLKIAYKACDLLVDIGPCMRQRLEAYGVPVSKTTLVPWALAESSQPIPIDKHERERIFGDAQLALLYSGNYGRAHSHDTILELARMLRGERIRFAFSVRGNRVEALQRAISKQDGNVVLVPFVPHDQLLTRLSAADIHLSSLRPEYTGVVVPSKFFGSLAVGRPVIFAGSPESGISKWIRDYGVGWVLQRGNIPLIAEELRKLASNREKLYRLQQHCYQIYQTHFSKNRIMDAWDMQLRGLLSSNKSTE